MIAKGHCRVRYGDGDDDEEAELEEFYDYTSRCVDSSSHILRLHELFIMSPLHLKTPNFS